LLVPLSGQNPKTAAHTDEGNGKQEIFVSGMRNAQRVKIILCAANISTDHWMLEEMRH
jgi:hypothetical protein